jgi:hypothetical protein
LPEGQYIEINKTDILKVDTWNHLFKTAGNYHF